MPSIPQKLTDFVFYLFEKNPKTGQTVGPYGTGSIISRASHGAAPLKHYYGITNKHVALDGASIIRINTRDGKTRPLKFGPEEWHFNDDLGDIAAIDLTMHLDANRDQVSCIDELSFVGEDFTSYYTLRLGADVFMIGLFVSHDGGTRNVPSAKFGNVSMLADGGAPVEQPHGKPLPAHLADMRSRTGYSGSPVFVYHNGDEDDLGNIIGDGRTIDYMSPCYLRLFGVHCAQFREQVRLSNPINA